MSDLRHHVFNIKYDADYVPKNPSAEARICLKCTLKKCNGNCNRYKEEYKKIKGRNNGK